MDDLLSKILMKKKDGSVKNLTVIIAKDDDEIEGEKPESVDDENQEEGLAPDAGKEEEKADADALLKGAEREGEMMAEGEMKPQGLRAKAQLMAMKLKKGLGK